jgi:lipoyl(octanoyl) transferase
VIVSPAVPHLTCDESANSLIFRHLGLCDYVPVWRAMQQFTDSRTEETSDELWLVEHPPVYTQGRAGKAEHVLAPGDIPIVQVDRGGQVTFHGPGQLVAYPLINLRRRKLGVRAFVNCIEQAIIDVLGRFDVAGERREGAPGIYVDGEKIAALGLRIRKGCSYHGLSFNIAMDLEPFSRINPCGFEGLNVVDLVGSSERVDPILVDEVEPLLVAALAQHLGHDKVLKSAPDIFQAQSVG